MSKKIDVKKQISFFNKLAVERSIIADCKLGKIDLGVSPGFLLSRERILDELEKQFYQTGKIPNYIL